MAMQTWCKISKQRHDPVHFLMRRSLCPQPRQTDRLLRQRIALAQDLHWKDLKGHYGCVNAIEFSHGSGELIASGGDDRRVLLWPVEKMLSDIGSPAIMKGEHNSNIFCIAFDLDNKTAFSGGNDEQVVVHDLHTGETKDVFPHEDAVYGLSADPCNPSVFASACDDGRLLIYDIRDSTAEPFCVANYTSSMHSVMYNPIEPRLLATANAKEGVGLWDVRKPKTCVLRYGGGYVQQSCMSVRFNQRGDQIIALRRRLPPVLYKIHNHMPVCEFDHTGYYNSCTMKSISFAGDNDQYVLSGSDDFNLYMWAIPEDLSERLYINSAHMVLRGHRSIVNQVRFNQANHTIISSGVEKIVKVWSPFQLPSSEPSVGKDLFNERPVYSHEDYINLVLRNGSMMTHDYTEASTEEDPRMIAFFDSLVQRELEGWSSDDTLSSNEEAVYNRIMQMTSSDSDSTISSISSLDDTLDDIVVDHLANDADVPETNLATDTLVGGLGVSRSTSAACPSVSMASSERAQSPQSSTRQGKRLSKLIRKKKEGLKDSFYRNRTRLTLSSSSDTSSDEEPVKTVIQKRPPEKSHKGKNPVAVQNLMKQRQQALKDSFVKLKQLKTLRNQVLHSDSDTEVNFGTKEIAQNVATNNEKDGSKEIKNVHHKAKKHPEAVSIGPYVHEMCHMFEANSPTEPVCSTSSGYCSSMASNASSTKVESAKASVAQSTEKSDTSAIQNGTKLPHQYKNKWKPIGSDNIYIHNNTSCDSNQINMEHDKHAVLELHDKCDNSQKDCDENITAALEIDVPTDAKMPFNSVTSVESTEMKLVDQKTADFYSNNEIDHKNDHIISNMDGFESVKDKHLKSVTEKNVGNLPSVPSQNLLENKTSFFSITETGNFENTFCLPTKDKTTSICEYHSDELEKHVSETGQVIRELSNTSSTIESKNDESLPSSSKGSYEQSKPDFAENSRAAWTEFKKRRKSDHSKKHYRGHNRSERRSSRD